jgi:tripartite-type tricarboxylate transporter receptor subunit TctC
MRRIIMAFCVFGSAFGSAIGALAFAAPAHAKSESQNVSLAQFYAGKTITVLVSSDPGGGYDAQARLLARHMGQFIPGHPSFVVQNMPGGGGILAANTIYNVLPQDGTALGVVQRGVITAEISHQSGVKFHVVKFTWVGNLASENSVLVAWHTAKVKTGQDLFTKQLIVGGTGATSDAEMGPRLYNNILGTKIKIISGYKGSTDVVMAMEKGEVEGDDWSWSNIKVKGQRYLKDHLLNLLIQSAMTRAPDLPNVPTEMELAKTDSDRKVIELFAIRKAVARPVMAGPGLPPDRKAALRKAFADMAKDPGFRKDAEKTKLEVDPMTGAEVEKLIDQIVTTPKDIADRFGAAVKAVK